MSSATSPSQHRGRERQQRGLRVAPRIGDERRRFDRLAVQLRQTVHGVPEQLGGGMLGTVRLLERGRRVQPEVGRYVDTPGAITDYGRKDRRAGPAGKRREGHVYRDVDALRDGEIDLPQVRQDLRQPFARGAPARDRDDLGVGMTPQQARELGARVSGHVDDTDFQPGPRSLVSLSSAGTSIGGRAARQQGTDCPGSYENRNPGG